MGHFLIFCKYFFFPSALLCSPPSLIQFRSGDVKLFFSFAPHLLLLFYIAFLILSPFTLLGFPPTHFHTCYKRLFFSIDLFLSLPRIWFLSFYFPFFFCSVFHSLPFSLSRHVKTLLTFTYLLLFLLIIIFSLPSEYSIFISFSFYTSFHVYFFFFHVYSNLYPFF